MNQLVDKEFVYIFYLIESTPKIKKSLPIKILEVYKIISYL